MLANIQAGADAVQLLAARPGPETAALLPATLDGLYGLIYALQAACTNQTTTARVLEIIDQFPDLRNSAALPIREAQTLAMEMLLQRALAANLEAAILGSPAYHRYLETRPEEYRYA